MVDRPALSRGETEVARILWEVGPATVREIFEAQRDSRKMEFATVQTYLRRLTNKGHAKSKLKGRVRIYAARTKPHTVIRETVNDLVQRLFAGESLPLVRHLIEERGIDADGLAELRTLIDEMEKGKAK